jgi:hypothetical protein
VKVALVGEGEHGKSTLLRRFRSLAARRRAVGGHGGRRSRGVRLGGFDFGGQEVLRATHLVFPTPKTVYLLVVSLAAPAPGGACDGEGRRHLHYCAEQVLRHGAGGSTFLIGTHADAHRNNYACACYQQAELRLLALRDELAAVGLEFDDGCCYVLDKKDNRYALKRMLSAIQAAAERIIRFSQHGARPE